MHPAVTAEASLVNISFIKCLLYFAVDEAPPEILFCPDDIRDTIEMGEENTSISWIEPHAADNSQHVIMLSQTHTPGDYFMVGKTRVEYIFADGSRNSAKCDFDVFLVSG